jgi:hypothetical protein
VTPTIILLSVVTWIPWGNKDDDTEKNGFISPDFVKSFISELLTDRSMSLFDVNVMSKISQEICFVVVMLSLSMFICLMTCLL